MTTYVEYEYGKSKMPFDTAIAIAEAFDISLDEMAGRGASALREFAPIPLLDVRAGAGGARENEDAPEVLKHLGLSRDWLRARGIAEKAVYAIQIAGDSMEGPPAHLHDGEMLFVDTGRREFGGDGVYVLRAGGGLLVKRLIRNFDGSIMVRSDNPDYPPQVVKGKAAQFDIVGVPFTRTGDIR